MVLTALLLLHLHFDPQEVATIKRFIAQQHNIARIEIADVRTTAYISPDPKQKNYKKQVRLNGKGIETSSGKKPRLPKGGMPGTIAADPKVPYGTILYVPDYGFGVVEDRGGSVRGDHFDLYYGFGEPAYKRAMAHGVSRTKVVMITMKQKEG